MCAGITTFNALRNSQARPGDLVGVLGVGGLEGQPLVVGCPGGGQVDHGLLQLGVGDAGVEHEAVETLVEPERLGPGDLGPGAGQVAPGQGNALTSREVWSPAAYCSSAVWKNSDSWSMLRLPK